MFERILGSIWVNLEVALVGDCCTAACLEITNLGGVNVCGRYLYIACHGWNVATVQLRCVQAYQTVIRG